MNFNKFLKSALCVLLVVFSLVIFSNETAAKWSRPINLKTGQIVLPKADTTQIKLVDQALIGLETPPPVHLEAMTSGDKVPTKKECEDKQARMVFVRTSRTYAGQLAERQKELAEIAADFEKLNCANIIAWSETKFPAPLEAVTSDNKIPTKKECEDKRAAISYVRSSPAYGRKPPTYEISVNNLADRKKELKDRAADFEKLNCANIIATPSPVGIFDVISNLFNPKPLVPVVAIPSTPISVTSSFSMIADDGKTTLAVVLMPKSLSDKTIFGVSLKLSGNNYSISPSVVLGGRANVNNLGFGGSDWQCQTKNSEFVCSGGTALKIGVATVISMNVLGLMAELDLVEVTLLDSNGFSVLNLGVENKN